MDWLDRMGISRIREKKLSRNFSGHHKTKWSTHVQSAR